MAKIKQYIIYSPDVLAPETVIVVDILSYYPEGGLTEQQWQLYDQITGGITCRLMDEHSPWERYTTLNRKAQ